MSPTTCGAGTPTLAGKSHACAHVHVRWPLLHCLTFKMVSNNAASQSTGLPSATSYRARAPWCARSGTLRPPSQDRWCQNPFPCPGQPDQAWVAILGLLQLKAGSPGHCGQGLMGLRQGLRLVRIA
jgi:hypothetical protein